MAKVELVEVSHISKKGTSLRLSIPKKVAERIRVGAGDIVGFYSDGERIWLERIKWFADSLQLKRHMKRIQQSKFAEHYRPD